MFINERNSENLISKNVCFRSVILNIPYYNILTNRLLKETIRVFSAGIMNFIYNETIISRALPIGYS